MRKAASQRFSYLSLFLVILISLMVTVSVPVAVSASATSSISAKALTSHDCDSSEWHFVITQVDSQGNAPAQIQVSWADGGSESVGMNKYTGKTAHYTTTSHLGSTVTSATATIYSGWGGEFNLSHGPCGNSASPQPTATATAAPTSTPTVVPTASPTVSPTVAPTATPVVTVNPTVAPTSTPVPVSNGLSDNLGCSVHDCSGNVVPQGGVVLGVSTATELPSTGAFNVMPLVYAFIAFVTGVTMIKAARTMENK
jgi:hypothetical protein